MQFSYEKFSYEKSAWPLTLKFISQQHQLIRGYAR